MIPLMKNTFLQEADTKRKLADFILNSSKLSMGEHCLAFEREFAEYQGRRFAVLFNSGGSANLALLQALKNLGRLQDGCKIGFSAVTWSTNVMPIIQLGMGAVPVDCEPKTLNSMSYNLQQTLQTSDLKAFFITNALGFTGDLQKIRELCEEKGIILIEDNCESLGTELPEGKAGNFGLAATSSFFVAHHMSTIEGGMAYTDDEELAEMLCIVRANGWDRNLNPAQQQKWRSKYGVKNEFEAKYAFYDLGYNLRPTEITGFLGSNQLQYLLENCKIRERNYRTIEVQVNNNPDMLHLESGHIQFLSSFSFPVVCKTKELREKYVHKFAQNNIEIRPMIAGNMLRQPFANKYINKTYNLPGADFLHDNGFYFGNYPELSVQELEMLAKTLLQ
jgi:CDP-4-dehydro-6-deoxyglucose reductase, E1